nr:winged helix-turn-helix domain-containing protein [uncultured Duganella sp.]
MPQSSRAPSEAQLAFGPFLLTPALRTLTRAGRPVPLHGRAFDLLLALVERAGEVVGKDELIARVWPSTVVEENNLRVHIGTLRKTLGGVDGCARCVENVVGRGYSFVAPVIRIPPTAIAAAPRHSAGPQPRQQQHCVIGRDQEIGQVAALIGPHRCVTIVGPGGVGKTTVALAVGLALACNFGERRYFVDLAVAAGGTHMAGTPTGRAPQASYDVAGYDVAAPQVADSEVASSDLASSDLADPALADTAVAAAVLSAMVVAWPAAATAHSAPLPTLPAFPRGQPSLLILDNCEHVIDYAAALAEALLASHPSLHILATSREPLRARGERLHRLAPLATPPDDATGEALLSYPAARLFAERAPAAVDGPAGSEPDLRHVGAICRRLDGLPLAIELAAARVDFLGLAGLATRLGEGLADSLGVLACGLRAGPPRHRSMRASLDWSFGLLTAHEQTLLQHLAVFHDSFTLEAAGDIAACCGIARATAFDALAGLHAKSLLLAHADGGAMRYRLLDTTRAYARVKLDAAMACGAAQGALPEPALRGNAGVPRTPHAVAPPASGLRAC